MRRRRLQFGGFKVTGRPFSATALVTVTGYSGATEYTGELELDACSTAAFVRELRRALHEVKAHVDRQVRDAEGPL